jgi:multidrug efflux pump subunit AcrA (membrane-fusion protein)
MQIVIEYISPAFYQIFNYYKKMDLNTVLTLTMGQITRFMAAEHSTLFLYDKEKNMLWSRLRQRQVKQGKEGHHTDFKEVWLKADCGITGYALCHGESVLCHVASQDPRFDARIDSDGQHVTHTLLCVPLFDPQKKVLGVVQVLNKHHGNFTKEDESLLKALCFQIAIAIENAQLYEHVNQLRDNESQLSAALQQQNGQLTNAYQQLTESNEELRTALRQVKISRIVSLLFVLGFIGSLFWFIHGKDSLVTQMASEEDVVAEKPSTRQIMQYQTMRATLLLSGYISPLDVVHIISPFNGKIERHYFNYHEKVKKGQLLLELDTIEEEIRAQEAKANHIKAKNHLDELKNWQNGPEVKDAKRHVHQLELEKSDLFTKEQENQRLLTMGIIPESEHRASVQALRQQELEYQTALQGLEAVTAKGQGQNLKVAELELNNAFLQLRAIEQRLKNAKIIAPVDGVIMPVKSNNDQPQQQIIDGKQVNQGEALFAIGNLTGIAVEAKVDEVDIPKIHEGQTVLVSGEAFPQLKLKGRVDSISAQADSEYGKVPFFNVRIIVHHIDASQRPLLRLGMSATLEVITYENEKALLLPLSALYQNQGQWWVKLKKINQFKEQAVILGSSNETSVEVIQGLNVGDEVYLP